jgi:hypothetical protein
MASNQSEKMHKLSKASYKPLNFKEASKICDNLAAIGNVERYLQKTSAKKLSVYLHTPWTSRPKIFSGEIHP